MMIQGKIKKSLSPFLLPGIMVLAGILRLVNLSRRDFWYDETFTGIAIRENFHNMMAMIGHDVHPPLYYFLAKIFSSAFSYSVFGIRLFSAIFGILGVLVVYHLAKELSGKKAGLIAAFITAVSPFAIQYSQEARMYTLYSFLIVLSAYFLVRQLKTEKTVYAVLWGAMLGLASLTHYISFIFLPVFIALAFIWKNDRFQSDHNQQVALYPVSGRRRRNILLGLLIFFIIFSPWAGKAVYQFNNNRGGIIWIERPEIMDLSNMWGAFFIGTPSGNLSQGVISPINSIRGPLNFYTGTILMIFTSVITILFSIRERQKGILLAMLFISGPLLLYTGSQIGYHYFVSRYLLPSAYLLFVFLGCWLAKLKYNFPYVFLALYLLIISSIVPLKVPNEWNSFKQELGKYDKNVFYVLNPFDYVIAKYYIGAERIVLFFADDPQDRPASWAAIGEGLKNTTQPEDLAVSPGAIVVSSLPLDRENNRPSTLDSLKFQKVSAYGLLYLFQAKSIE